MSKIDLFIPTRAPSHRQEKVAESLRMALASLCIKGDFPPVEDQKGNLVQLKHSITITKVTVSPDLQHASAYFVTLGGQELEFAEEYLNSIKAHFRFELGKKITLKYTPTVTFIIDKGLEAQERINALLDA